MQIKLLGTGAPLVKENSSAILIDEETIVDVPNGILKQMMNMNLRPEKIQYMNFKYKLYINIEN